MNFLAAASIGHETTIVGKILFWIGWIFLLLLLARVVFSYVFLFARDYTPSGVMLLLVESIYSATDPGIKLFRRFIPPLRLGSVQLDLSLMVLMLIVSIFTFSVTPLL